MKEYEKIKKKVKCYRMDREKAINFEIDLNLTAKCR